MLTGVELGGGIYSADNLEGMNYSEEEKVTMFFEFYCGLNSGTYFINCGISGNGGQSLHRIIDAMPLRITPSKNKTHSFGIIDFGYTRYITDIFTRKDDLT